MSPTEQRWSRPASVPVPTVWRRCVGLKEIDGKRPVFRIQDIPEDMEQDAIDFMSIHFVRDEALNVALKFDEDPVSIRELQRLWRNMLKEKISLIAVLEENDEHRKPKIVGCNMLSVKHKGEKSNPAKFEGRCQKIIGRDMEYVGSLVNVFENYGVNEYMTALGLCVDPVYRGQGLGLEILKARVDIGRAVGLKAMMTIFTGPAAQKQAERAGMETLLELSYDQFKEEDGSPVYPNIPATSMKLMTMRI